MAQLVLSFDATKFDPSQVCGQLPIGKHKVHIKSSEIKSTAAGDGGMLILELEILEGPNAGQTGLYRLNLYCEKNQQAKDIAHRQLSAICHVIQVFQIQDSAQLHGKPFIVQVGLQKGEEAAEKGYTEVQKVFDLAGNEPGKQGQSVAAQQSTPTPAPTPTPAAQPTQWGNTAQPAAQGGNEAAPQTWGGGNAAPPAQPAQPAQGDNTPPWGQQG